jgi:hypothetical protein
MNDDHLTPAEKRERMLHRIIMILGAALTCLIWILIPEGGRNA